MIAPKLKDKKKRICFFKQEEKKRCVRLLKHNSHLQCEWWARHKLSSFKSDMWKNRCIFTNRGPATLRDLKVSRLEFRRWAVSKKFPGLSIGSW